MLRTLAVAAALALSTLHATAQTYPNRPVTLVVPFPPGGSTTIVARIVADRMAEALGQPIVVDNRGGAGGTIGTRAVAKSIPDGYTLLLGYTGTLAIGPTLYPNAGYDPRKDFAPVGLIGNAPNSLVVHPSFAPRSVQELIAYAKANPGAVNYGSAGVGTVSHVSGEYFATAAGIKLTHVPYRGTGPALADLIGGHIPMAFAPIPATHGPVAQGQLRGLAVTSAKRSSLVPDMPTIANPASRASRRPCSMGSWRQPARRVRSSTSSTRRCAPHLPPMRCASDSRPTAPSRHRRHLRNTPTTSTRTKRAGRR